MSDGSSVVVVVGPVVVGFVVVVGLVVFIVSSVCCAFGVVVAVLSDGKVIEWKGTVVSQVFLSLLAVVLVLNVDRAVVVDVAYSTSSDGFSY